MRRGFFLPVPSRDPSLKVNQEKMGELPHAWNCVHYALVRSSALGLTHSTRTGADPSLATGAWAGVHVRRNHRHEQ
jgi:hypothetical protein